MPTVYDRLGVMCPTVAGADMRDWWQMIYTHLAEFDTNYATNLTSLTAARQLLNRLQASNGTNITAITSAKTLLDEIRLDSYTNYTAVSEQKTAFLNHSLNYVNIRSGSSGASIRVGNALSSTVEAVIDGVIYSLPAIGESFATPTDSITACATTGAERVYTFQLSTNGTLTHTTGTVATGAPGVAVVPDYTAGQCPVGHVRIRLDAGAATGFIGGTTTLLASQVNTVTYTNVFYLPAWISDHAPVLTSAIMSAAAAANTCTAMPAPAIALATDALPSLVVEEASKTW